MTPQACDLAVIGAGAAGLSVAAGAARLGRSVVLIECGEMGGECLNTGCVPSKALLAAAARAQAARRAGDLGVRLDPPQVDFPAVMAHVRAAIAAIAPNDSQDRFEGLGVRVIRDRARFADPRTLVAGGETLRPRRVVLATGSRPAIPPVPGLDRTPYLTNETVWGLDALPPRLLILGGGAVGMELSQAFARLGSDVTVVDAGTPLSAFDPEHAADVRAALRAEGVGILENARVARAEPVSGGGAALVLEDGARLEGEALLVAAGRAPADHGLDLAAAGIETDSRGFPVTREDLRTTNRRVFAAGDAAGRTMLTHAAGAHASLLIRNFYYFQRARLAPHTVPAALYTDPELAQIGLTEAQARERCGDTARTVGWAFAENDRAICEGETEGGVKLIAGRGGKLLGASVLGPQAGDLIQIVQAAMAAGAGVKALTGIVSAYPTRGEAVKRAAGAWYEDLVFGPWARRIAALAARLH